MEGTKNGCYGVMNQADGQPFLFFFFGQKRQEARGVVEDMLLHLYSLTDLDRDN